MKSLYDCLVVPVMTEKAMNSKSDGVYVFKVNVDSTKIDIKKAVEKVFDVKVSKVNVLNRQGKQKSFRSKKGETKSRKIAIVSLAKGGVINFEGGI